MISLTQNQNLTVFTKAKYFPDHGTVMIIRGKHRHRYAYYDDDKDDKLAVVYFDKIFGNEWDVVEKRHLIPTKYNYKWEYAEKIS
jgi:hypothetical protein